MDGRPAMSKDTGVFLSSILHTWRPVVAGCRQYCEERDVKYPSGTYLSCRTYNALRDIVARYNSGVDHLGKMFAHGDNILRLELDDVETGELSKVASLVNQQLSSGRSSASQQVYDAMGFDTSVLNAETTPASTSSEPKDWEMKAESFLKLALSKTLQAIEGLAQRQGTANHQINRITGSPMVNEPVDYCRGATLLQKTNADCSSILEQRSSGFHYCCKYCYLEISAFQAKCLNYTAEDWRIIASCHILAYPSLQDRRAAYRCYACYAHTQQNNVWMSASKLRSHVELCPYAKATKLSQNSSSLPIRPRGRSPDVIQRPSPPLTSRNAEAAPKSRTPPLYLDAQESLPAKPPRPEKVENGPPKGPPRRKAPSSAQPSQPIAPQTVPISIAGTIPPHQGVYANQARSPASGNDGQRHRPSGTDVNGKQAAVPPRPVRSPPDAPQPPSTQFVPNEDHVALIVEAVGRTRAQAIELLRLENNNLEQAFDRGIQENKAREPEASERRRAPY